MAYIFLLVLVFGILYFLAYGVVAFAGWKRGTAAAHRRYGAPAALERGTVEWYNVADDATEVLRDLLREDERTVPFLRLEDRERAETIVSRFNDMRGSR